MEGVTATPFLFEGVAWLSEGESGERKKGGPGLTSLWAGSGEAGERKKGEKTASDFRGCLVFALRASVLSFALCASRVQPGCVQWPHDHLHIASNPSLQLTAGLVHVGLQKLSQPIRFHNTFRPARNGCSFFDRRAEGAPSYGCALFELLGFAPSLTGEGGKESEPARDSRIVFFCREGPG